MAKRTLILCLLVLLLMSTTAWVYCIVVHPTGLFLWVATSAVQTFSSILVFVSIAYPPTPPWAEGFNSDQDLYPIDTPNCEVGNDYKAHNEITRLLA